MKFRTYDTVFFDTLALV